MRKTELRRTFCIVMAALTTISLAACGGANRSNNNVRELDTVVEITIDSPDESVEASDETGERRTTKSTETTREDADGSETSTDISDSKSGADTFTRAYEGSAADKYPNAEFIEKISDGRFIIINRDRQADTVNVIIYDIVKDEVIKEITVDSEGESLLTPTVFEGKGFGFIIPGKYREPGAKAYYYDTEGNLVNTFEVHFEPDLNDSYVLAPDGSALYAVVNDRVQCACGYDFKADYTTQVYKVYPDGSTEKLANFDSHYSLAPFGVTDDGRIVFVFRYDEHDLVVKTHKEYEMGNVIPLDEIKMVKIEDTESDGETDDDVIISVDELKKKLNEKEDDGKKVEAGYALMNTDSNASHELEKIYLTNHFYVHYFVRGNNIILTDDDEVLRLHPDQNGEYKATHFETPVGLKNYYESLYVSPSGDYVVFPQYTEERMDTTVNVLRFDGDKADLIFQEYNEGKKIDFHAVFLITYFDEETGDFYGYYDETREGGARRQMYKANVYED